MLMLDCRLGTGDKFARFIYNLHGLFIIHNCKIQRNQQAEHTLNLFSLISAKNQIRLFGT